MLEAPKRAVKFASNDFWGQTYRGMYGTDRMNQKLSVLTGMSAGATEAFVVVPFELVKIRLQDKASTYSGPMDVCRTIVRQNGVLGFYQGLESTFWRHVWWSTFALLSLYIASDRLTDGGYFGCIFQVKALLPKPEVRLTAAPIFILGPKGRTDQVGRACVVLPMALHWPCL